MPTRDQATQHMEDDEFQAFMDRAWEELPQGLKDKAVRYLQKRLDDNFFRSVKEAYAKNPVHWSTADVSTERQRKQNIEQYGQHIPQSFHFSGGMSIRNLLRDVIKDDELPDVDGNGGNWDNFYTQAIEAAAGLREV